MHSMQTLHQPSGTPRWLALQNPRDCESAVACYIQWKQKLALTSKVEPVSGCGVRVST